MSSNFSEIVLKSLVMGIRAITTLQVSSESWVSKGYQSSLQIEYLQPVIPGVECSLGQEEWPLPMLATLSTYLGPRTWSSALIPALHPVSSISTPLQTPYSVLPPVVANNLIYLILQNNTKFFSIPHVSKYQLHSYHSGPKLGAILNISASLTPNIQFISKSFYL